MNFRTVYEVDSCLYGGVAFASREDAEAFAAAHSAKGCEPLRVRERLLFPARDAGDGGAGAPRDEGRGADGE